MSAVNALGHQAYWPLFALIFCRWYCFNGESIVSNTVLVAFCRSNKYILHMARGIYVHIRASLLAVTLSAPKLHKLAFSSTCGLKSLTNPAFG